MAVIIAIVIVTKDEVLVELKRKECEEAELEKEKETKKMESTKMGRETIANQT